MRKCCRLPLFERKTAAFFAGLSGFYKTDASGFRHFPEANGSVKGDGFRIVIRYKLNLAYHAVSLKNFLKKCGTDSFSLIFRKHQQILYENNGVASPTARMIPISRSPSYAASVSSEFSNPLRNTSGDLV